MKKTAVLLMDYGAPTTSAQVRHFIYSILAAKWVLPLPWGLRHLLAWFISVRRAKFVCQRYDTIGGSPLPRQLTQLAHVMERDLGEGYIVLPAYCHAEPKISRVVAALVKLGVDTVVGLPLFPQRSWTTSDVCEQQLTRATTRYSLGLHWIDDYPDASGLIDAHVQNINAKITPTTHVLMVAHGLPKRIAEVGDMYPERVQITADAIAKRLPKDQAWSLAFQSRVGPAEWTGPYLSDEIKRLADTGVDDLLFVALSFATENLEVCWDLDKEATVMAYGLGISRVERSAQPCTHPSYQTMLRGLVTRRLDDAQ